MAFRYIASIYPIELRAERGIYGGVFRLPAYKGAAGADQSPVMYQIKDHVQVDTLPWIMAPDGARRQSQTRVIIHAKDIAMDIIREWTQTTLGMTPDCRPGIWLVRDQVAMFNDDGTPMIDAMGMQESRPATREEREEMFEEDLAQNLQAQANWGDYCITQGDIMGETVKAIPFIPQYCKILCKYYGRDRKWLHKLQDGDFKNCQFCKKSIPPDAVKCQHCQEIVDRKGYEALVGRGGDVTPSPTPLSVKPEDVRKRAGLAPLNVETYTNALKAEGSSTVAVAEPESPEPVGEDWEKELAELTQEASQEASESEEHQETRRAGRPRGPRS